MKGLHYLCSKNKGADQLCSHCRADLHLYFHIYADCCFSDAAAHLYLHDFVLVQLLYMSINMRKHASFP